MISYCVSCKRKTDSVGEHVVTGKKGKKMVKSKCSVCHKGKSRIMGKQEGGFLPLLAPLLIGPAAAALNSVAGWGVNKLLKGHGNGRGLRPMGSGVRIKA